MRTTPIDDRIGCLRALAIRRQCGDRLPIDGRSSSRTPRLVASYSAHSSAAGLLAGVDGDVVTPCTVDPLLGRVEAVLRRPVPGPMDAPGTQTLDNR
jgi:hypothetical protein